MVAQDWADRWRDRLPFYHEPLFPPPTRAPKPADLAEFLKPVQPVISRQEFDALKAELEAVKKLLVAAKQYDKETGQPDCEDAEKVRLFKRLAELVGVDLSAVFA